MLVTMAVAKPCPLTSGTLLLLGVVLLSFRFSFDSHRPWSLIGLGYGGERFLTVAFHDSHVEKHSKTGFHGLEISLTVFWRMRVCGFGWIDHFLGFILDTSISSFQKSTLISFRCSRTQISKDAS